MIETLKHSKRSGARGKRPPKRESQAPLLDLLESKKARDAGIEQVADHAETFMAKAMRVVETMRGRTTGEMIRVELTARGITPHHPNAWGAVVLTAVRRKILVDTGEMTHMVDVRSHARRTPVYNCVGHRP